MSRKIGVDSRDTPILLASYYDAVEIVQELLTHGANPSIRNKLGYTPMIYARKYHYEKLKTLLENAKK